MFRDLSKKNRAIELRKEGKSYSEILNEVFVAKSTLSLWLHGVGLAKKQVQRLTEKKLEASKRGGQIKRQQRIDRFQEIYNKSLSDIKYISKRELWLIGIVLYWSEGTKEKEYNPGSSIQFSNSDPRMIKVFIKWLEDVCNISRDKIKFEIYIHENNKDNLNRVIAFWSKMTGFSKDNFSNIYFKKHSIKTNRKNTKNLYFGLLRVKVSASSNLVRQVAGWTEGIVKNLK